MLFLKCPACGAVLGHIQIIYELYMRKIDTLKLTREEKDDRKAELARMLVRDFCCRGLLLSFVDIASIAS
jgi:DNA-directed RNA polymerase subunit N (RpoN/RPB10)